MMFKKMPCVILQVLTVVNSIFINIYSHNCHRILKDELDSVVFQHEIDFFSCIDSNETTSSVTNEH